MITKRSQMKISRIVRFAFKKESIIAMLSLLFTGVAFASGAVSAEILDLTTHPVGYLSLLIFAFTYGLVIAEEFTHLRKSKPVIRPPVSCVAGDPDRRCRW
jgi:hypothetical protein